MSTQRKRSWRALLVVATAMFVLIPAAVYASHVFGDVPDSDYGHDAIAWVADKEVTLGCGGGNYCPDDPVTRRDMALFMQRQAQNMGPIMVTDFGSGTYSSPIAGATHKLSTLTVDVPLDTGGVSFYSNVFGFNGADLTWAYVDVRAGTDCTGGSVSTEGHMNMGPTAGSSAASAATVGWAYPNAGLQSYSLCLDTSSAFNSSVDIDFDFVIQWMDDANQGGPVPLSGVDSSSPRFGND